MIEGNEFYNQILLISFSKTNGKRRKGPLTAANPLHIFMDYGGRYRETGVELILYDTLESAGFLG